MFGVLLLSKCMVISHTSMHSLRLLKDPEVERESVAYTHKDKNSFAKDQALN